MTTATRSTAKKPPWWRSKKLLLGASLLLAAVAAYYFFGSPGSGGPSLGTTFTVAKGDLNITVLEGGSIAAQKSLQLKSEVQGQTKILSIVEEGYLVTPEDVTNGLVLIELDSKELLDQLTERELSYQRALADFTQAREEYEIQRTQNQSDIAKAETTAKFGLLDFEKYLGQQAARDILAATNAEAQVLSEPLLTETGGAGEPGEVAEPREESTSLSAGINFADYAESALRGDGQAQQLLRKADDDYMLAQQELEASRSQVEGTKRLFEREFVTRLELEKDELELQRAEIKLASAETARDLYRRYEFPKEAEKLFSDYVEALRALERVRRSADAKMAQAEAKLNAAQAQYDLQKRKKEELEDQIEKCVMRATQPGLVVYGDGGNDYWRNDDRIEEGAFVRERQAIITIPDTTVMTVELKVHESQVKSVRVGQRASVRLDAYPDRPLQGEVTKIAVLPDSQNRWMNPDLKVYSTTVRIDGTHDWLKPGMTAEAEVFVKTLEDVVYVPIQAVNPVDDGHVCYVRGATGAETRKVKVGEFNNTFIEIQSGLEPGERVLLRAPDAGTGREKKNEGERGEKQEKDGGEGKGRERSGEGATQQEQQQS